MWQKKRALPFFISTYYFFSSILRFLTKRGRQVCHWASVVRPLTYHILINSSEATGPIWTILWWNGPWMAPFQNCFRWSQLPTKMAVKLKIEKRGDETLIVHCCFSISQNELKHRFRVFLWNFSFSRFIPIMQIRHILIKDHI